MLTHSWWFLAVDALATFRLAMLVAKDSITAPAREWLRSQGWEVDVHSGLPMKRRSIGTGLARVTHELAVCPWCNSIWFGAVVVALTRLWPSGWQYPAMALALSGVAGFLAER